MLLGAWAPAQARELRVVASFSIIADMARQVGGDHIRLATLVGPDGDSHVYEPTPADAVAVAEADVVLVNGLQFEGFIPRLVQASGTRARLVEVSRGIEPLEAAGRAGLAEAAGGAEAGHGAHGQQDGHGHPAGQQQGSEPHAHHHHGKYDPHAWQSARNAQVYVGNIIQALCEADQADCGVYQSNGNAYLARLRALDDEIAAMMRAIPPDRRRVISSHAAFGYFSRAYGITFLAPEGISTDADPTAADVAALIAQARAQQVAAIFMENITNPRLIRQIADETGMRVNATLYSDALSGASGPAATYVDMMRYNANAIRAAIMGGPAAGRQAPGA
ncbi:metal ABC transporter solute-binding protein, Zn/Mn family [Pigmentiphaga soli]